MAIHAAHMEDASGLLGDLAQAQAFMEPFFTDPMFMVQDCTLAPGMMHMHLCGAMRHHETRSHAAGRSCAATTLQH